MKSYLVKHLMKPVQSPDNTWEIAHTIDETLRWHGKGWIRSTWNPGRPRYPIIVFRSREAARAFIDRA